MQSSCGCVHAVHARQTMPGHTSLNLHMKTLVSMGVVTRQHGVIDAKQSVRLVTVSVCQMHKNMVDMLQNVLDMLQSMVGTMLQRCFVHYQGAWQHMLNFEAAHNALQQQTLCFAACLHHALQHTHTVLCSTHTQCALQLVFCCSTTYCALLHPHCALQHFHDAF